MLRPVQTKWPRKSSAFSDICYSSREELIITFIRCPPPPLSWLSAPGRGFFVLSSSTAAGERERQVWFEIIHNFTTLHLWQVGDVWSHVWQSEMTGLESVVFPDYPSHSISCFASLRTSASGDVCWAEAGARLWVWWGWEWRLATASSREGQTSGSRSQFYREHYTHGLYKQNISDNIIHCQHLHYNWCISISNLNWKVHYNNKTLYSDFFFISVTVHDKYIVTDVTKPQSMSMQK